MIISYRNEGKITPTEMNKNDNLPEIIQVANIMHYKRRNPHERYVKYWTNF